MLIGYMRVSTSEQNLALQPDALEDAGCGRLYQDTCSGAVRERHRDPAWVSPEKRNELSVPLLPEPHTRQPRPARRSRRQEWHIMRQVTH